MLHVCGAVQSSQGRLLCVVTTVVPFHQQLTLCDKSAIYNKESAANFLYKNRFEY